MPSNYLVTHLKPFLFGITHEEAAAGRRDSRIGRRAGKSALARVLRQHDRALRTSLSLWGLPLHLLALNVFRTAPVLFSWSMATRCLHWDEIKQIVRLSALCQLLRGRTSLDNRTLVLDEGGVFGLAKLFAFAAMFSSAPSCRKN